jgi:hypothetical protein
MESVISETQAIAEDCDLDNLSPVIIGVFAQWIYRAHSAPGIVQGPGAPGSRVFLACCRTPAQGTIFMKDAKESSRSDK